ncbi:PilC/PilY family type IV pilus protein [Variovorax sp. LjRoot84]|uniref:PilC/PilY family type IV pilus protein n=1 Tax=Variovorax sp. LjRoot84 TaxID=3342340 RepID=UPI003ECEF069
MNTPSYLAARFARAAALAALFGLQGWASAASLADQPVFATSNVPGNLALTLSVEWPTASRTAHTANYTSNSTYLGYFDPNKCYTYVSNTAVNPAIPVTNPVTVGKGDLSYFNPTGVAVGRKCTGSAALNAMWSGNFLNWAATATIDPFRWAMTGGRRVVDTATETILEKGWHSGQGLFNDRNLTASEIADATPFDSATSLLVSINGRGFAMQTTTSGAALKGEYFNDMTATGTPVLTVNNDSADHNWGNASPGTGVNADRFSARYTGSFVAPATGTYTFRVTADDGVRLSVNGTMLINQWRDQGPTDYTANVNLTAGQAFDLQVDYYENAGGATLQLAWQKPGGSFEAFTNSIGAATSNVYTMRNKVCDPNAPGGVESNCKQYGSNWKPEGLIQQYSHRMRFSAFGYLNESGNGRDGGVLRARQKFVGPTQPVPGLPDVTNSEGEWSATDGTFIRNPNAADATASSGSGVTISDSGVINYLNKFGQLLPGNYKGNDPVGELYYAALRYYRNLGNVPEWSNLTTTDAARATQLDGFPVITNWTDPIQYSCQRNFILGIGDIYTHGDKNVPGNTNTANEPTLPTLVANDTTVNAVTATNKVGQLQGMGDDLGTRTNVSNNCCSNNSARMAGLAYDANTKDIRPDVATSPNTIGKQTVQTYWVDVLERAFQVNNQFYLASKYGGLKLPTNIQDTFDPYTFTGPIPTSWWSTNGETLTEGSTTQERPDNYFTAGRPDTMVDGLTKAFASIANAIKSFTTSFSLSTAQVSSSGAASYASQYDSNGWTGVLTASRLTFVSGIPTLTEVWSSATTLAAQLASGGWDSNRRVVTWNGTTGVPFRSGSLTTDQLTALDTPWATGNDSVNYLNYLRGDRTNERTSTDETKPYRLRPALLGDIANAKVTPVGPPSARLSNTVNPGYATFKTTYVNRKTVVYVGANDGMLHAFDGALSGTGAGNELFAYVPSPLFSGPSSPATPTLNGLGQLGNPNYEHRYYVDATPKAFDLDFNTAGGVFTTTASGGSDWKSLLVGGLGKGGKSFYAIDITDPSTMTTEDLVKAKIKWEFSNATTGVSGTLGFSYGAPLVLKTKKYGWVVVFSSGYNNSDGNGYIYFVNPRDGSLLEKVQTGNASAGLTQMTAYISDYTDGTADAIYAGDLNGQLWRFDVTAARGSTAPYPAPLKLATLADANGNAQPITTAPLVEVDPKTKKRYVMLGTGQLLDTVDINSSAAQTFYAIIDGTSALFGSGGTYPLTRSNLEGLSDAELTGQTAINFGTAQGWFIELGSTSNIGWRSITSATSFNGVVAFATLLTTGNACSPSGQSRVYAVNFGTGVTALVPGDTPYAGYTHAITDLKFISDNGTVRLVAGDVEGKQHVPPVNLGGGSSLRLLNWREIPAVD